jgi:hypothetical protein
MSSPAPVAWTPGSRRRPWPYDAYIGNVRVLLEPDQDGNLISDNSKTLDATAPIDYTYSSANPYKERTSEWQHLYGGFGQAVADEVLPPHRYWYAEKCDVSVNGAAMKGPAFEQHIETVNAGAGEVRQLIQGLIGGVTNLFAMCQNGVYYQAPGTGSWTQTLTAGTGPALPGGVHPTQAVRFKHRGAGALDCIYLAADSGNLWRFDGTTWAVCAVGAGPPDYGTGIGQARYIEKVGDELWVAGDYGVAKCEADPTLRASWSAPIYVGDQSARITWLRQVNDTLYIFKEDGIYTITTTGLDRELFPTLRGKNSMVNGRNASVWLDRIWFTYGNQTFTLNSTGQLRADGLEQMLENTSPVRGRWVDGAGHNTWFFYEVYYDEITDDSFLVKHGTWIEETSNQDTPGISQFAESHHGALYDWQKRATTCDVVAGWDSTGNDRLYVGFVDGTLTWTRLPRHSPNPSDDINCEFTVQNSWVYLPQHHSNFRADNKLWHAMTTFGPRMNDTEWVEIEYKTDVTNPFAAWTKVDPVNPKFTLSGQRHNMTDNEVNNPVFGRQILTRLHLIKDPNLSASPLRFSPVVEGIAIHESIRPAFSREFIFTVRIGSFLPKRDGTVDRRRATTVLDEVLKTCATIGPVYVLLPTGQVEQMTITNYQDMAAPRQKVRDFSWMVKIEAIQLRTITQGAVQTQPPLTTGLTYATLEQYTLGDLESII